MRKILLALVLLAAALAPAAGAKEITGAQLCGPQGCTDVDIPKGLHQYPGGGHSDGPPAAGPFLELRLDFDGMHVEQMWYVPAAHAFADQANAGSIRWLAGSDQELDRVIAATAAGVAPYRPRAVAALVGDRRVAGDVSGYLGLFGVESAGRARMEDGGYELISVKTDPASPWALTPLFFYPGQRLLERGGTLILLPRGIADDLTVARPIGSGPRSGFDWPLVSASLVVALALALTAALLGRRAARGRPPAVLH